MSLTQKQESFCLKYIETGNLSEAYRFAYDAERMSAQVVHVEAHRLASSPKVSLRLEELRGTIMERHKITVDTLLEELEEARQVALACETPQSSAAVGATMGKAKLLGLDKQVLEHVGPNGGPIVTSIAIDKSTLDDIIAKL